MRFRTGQLLLLVAVALPLATASAAVPSRDAHLSDLDPKERATVAQSDPAQALRDSIEAGPTALNPDDLLDLDDPAAPLHFDFPDLERIARPTGFANVSESSFDVVLYRSGRQIYLYIGVDGGAASGDLEVAATFWEHETDAGIPDRLRRSLIVRGASEESADEAVAAIEEMLQRPYRWQALCFSVEQRVDVLGIAGVR